MSKKSTPSKMVATKNKVLSCSTPEHRAESSSRDSDSPETASPVPFLCTQDGTEGEIDVVWNFYTPKSEHAATSRLKNSTPLSRKSKKSLKPEVIEKPLPKRRIVKVAHKNTELFQDLLELNQNLHELIAKKSKNNIKTEKPQSGSEDDIFSDSGDCSPKTGLKTSSRCLRRNLLISSKFGKPETDTALESDDSMNECLIKASQVVEENILNHEPTPAKRSRLEQNSTNKPLSVRPGFNINMDHDSMDAILNSIKLDSPVINKAKKCDSPRLKNDSFDSFVGNLNDSALERLTQMPAKNSTANRNKLNMSDTNDWTVQELVVHDGSPVSKSFFGRHNSMPESPSVSNLNKPSTSGMVFGRYNSMPYNKDTNKSTVPGDSPIRCTPDEIKRKHQQAREKLLAKRLLPFTSTQQHQNLSLLPSQETQQIVSKKTQFQPKVPSSAVNKPTNVSENTKNDAHKKSSTNSVDLKLLIERKRQEALMKLRRRQPQNKRI